MSTTVRSVLHRYEDGLDVFMKDVLDKWSNVSGAAVDENSTLALNDITVSSSQMKEVRHAHGQLYSTVCSLQAADGTTRWRYSTYAALPCLADYLIDLGIVHQRHGQPLPYDALRMFPACWQVLFVLHCKCLFVLHYNVCVSV